MARSFERMRDRLPTLWRPEDDDASGDPLPLLPHDVRVECEPPREATFTLAGTAVVAELSGPARLRRVHVSAQRALATGCAVEVYRVVGARPQNRPALAAVVRGGAAELERPFEASRFALRLRRPGLLQMLLRASAEVVDRLDEEAAATAQAHWHGWADRAALSPFFHRSRELLHLATPRPGDAVEIRDAPALVERVRGPDAFAAWLRGELPAEVRGYLRGRDESVPFPLQRALVETLDRLVDGPLVFDAARFAGIALDPATQAGVADPPDGGVELAELNLALLLTALGGSVARASDDSPYIQDLARIGSLLALPPWTDPGSGPETVEEYRERLLRIVRLYRDGVGTLSAVRRMVEAQLPTDRAAAPERRDRGFLVEENAPAGRRVLAARTDGAPDGIVGPLMRWKVENQGIAPVPCTLYVQGMEPDPPAIDPTEQPVIELLAAGGTRPRVGIAYDDTIAPGKTLRIRPAFSAWLATDDGLLVAESRPDGESPASPVPPGPWGPAAGAPDEPPSALARTRDGTLWAAFATEVGMALWRRDHAGWKLALDGVPTVRALLEDGDALLLATEIGLRRVALYTGGSPSMEDFALGGRDVRALLRAADGRLLAGMSDGAATVAPNGDHTELLFDSTLESETTVHAILQDAETGTLYFGTGRGVFQHQPWSGLTWWLSGREADDRLPDWLPFNPENGRGFPGADDPAIPPVRALHRGRDAALWLGTDAGLARYVARPAGGLAYTTLLEAFPDLVPGPVFALREDERGELWICADRGLFRFDGRVFWQLRGDRWAQLGRADLRYVGDEPRPAYRFDRASSRWQSLRRGAWVNVNDRLRSSAEDPVRDVFWSDGAAADLGTWDGAAFTSESTADETKLRMRIKPDDTRIVDGGVPAVPRLPAGTSEWRYLALEPEGMAEPAKKPAWSREGRFFPPPEGLPDPYPGRYDLADPKPSGSYDEAVYAFPPAARAWLEWAERGPLSVLARLRLRDPAEAIDPAVLDRVWEGMRQVRPAGVRALLAVEETIVRE